MKDKKDSLPKIEYGNRPKVLLVGNGINLSFSNSKRVDKIIQNEWKMTHKKVLPNFEFGSCEHDKTCEFKKYNHEIWGLPFPLQVVVATNDHVQECLTRLANSFRNIDVEERQKDFIKQILDTNFDAILSTNYSMEFEKSVIKDYSANRVYKYYRTKEEQSSLQKQFGIFQCTELPYANHPSLWHIHGTALRKNSLIMGQLYYGSLLSEVIKQARAFNRKYRNANKNREEINPESWIDYFLLGDVYIFGFKADFSESDIWWLLSYKKSQFEGTKVYFFEPYDNKALELILQCYNVQVAELPHINESLGDEKYIQYYKDVCKCIRDSMF